MVRPATLIKTDESVHQIILHISANMPSPIIIRDLDEKHVLIDASHVEMVKERVEEILEANISLRK